MYFLKKFEIDNLIIEEKVHTFINKDFQAHAFDFLFSRQWKVY